MVAALKNVVVGCGALGRSWFLGLETMNFSRMGGEHDTDITGVGMAALFSPK